MQTKRTIPAIAFRIMAVLATFIVGPLLTVQAATAPISISVVAVNPNEDLQVVISNLPANTDFTVTESAAGNQGVGPVIAHFNSVDGGTRSYWFEMLTDVRSETSAEIRIDSGTGFHAYATFNPTTTLSSTSTTTTTPTATATPAATTTTTTTATVVAPSVTMGKIQVVHVQKGGIVVAELTGMPLDTQFTVTVGAGGSQGYGGFMVGNLSTGSLSDHIGSFEIPVDLASNATLDLRIEAPGYLYLVTFNNIDK